MAESGQYSNSILAASQGVKDKYCQNCHRKRYVAIAEGYCVDCPEYLCEQCCKSHRRNKIFSNHLIFDNNSTSTAPDACDEKCTSHPNKVIELFCETCNKVGCHICLSKDHRQCKMKYIADIVKDCTDLKRFNEDIKSTAEKLSKYEEKLQAIITSNNKMKELAEQELQHQRAEINKIFDQLEKNMNDRMKAIEKRNEDSMKSASNRMDHIKKEFDQIKHDIEAKDAGQRCGQFIAMKRNEEKIEALDEEFINMEHELRIQCYTLLSSEQMLTMIQAMKGTTTELFRMTKASLETQIDIPSPRIPRLSIECLTTVQGHYCVVADNSNSTIRVIDTKSKCVTSETNIEAIRIWSITSVNNDQVAVSVLAKNKQTDQTSKPYFISTEKKKQIQFFTVSSSGNIQRTNQQYDVDDHYVDMVYCKGNIYGIGNEYNRINVHSMTGEIIRTIGTYEKVVVCICTLKGIAVSPDEQTLYVIDSHKHSVTSLTLDGKVKAIKNLQNPSGITVDKYGYVYVCAGNICSKRIQQFTADLKTVQALLENQVPIHYGNGNNMTYSSTEHKLYISAGTQINQYSLDC